MGFKLQQGAILYSGYITWTGRIEITKFYVKTIRMSKGIKLVTAVKKNDVTWVKKSKKQFDYGWADYIDQYDKEQFPYDDGLPKDVFFTEKAAYNYQLRVLKQKISKYKAQLKKAEKKYAGMK